MRAPIARYAALLRQPGSVRLLAFTFVARLPLGTLTLALLLHVRDLTGSFAVAGSASGAYLLAMGLAAPFLGRLVDRRGPRLPLLVTGIIGPLVLLGVLFARQLAWSPSAIVAIAAVAGAFAPPITVLTRTAIRYRFERDDERRIAYALDSVLVEMCFTLGPLLVAALLVVANPFAAFAAAWVFAALAAPLFAWSTALRVFHIEPDAHRHLLGPLTQPQLLVIYLVSFLIAYTFGLMEVGYPAFGVSFGIAALGAVLIAVNSAGSALGGLAYGGMQMAMPPERMLPRVLALMVLPLGAHALTGSPWVLATLAFLAGLLIAPALTVVMLLVSTRAPPRYATEAFTWSSTCIVGGVGLGAASGGRLAETFGAPALFVLASGSIAMAALVATSLRTRLGIS